MTNYLWPELVLKEWEDTRATLHMWTQVIGKIRLAATPLVNHWWNVPLYVSARGLTTSAMPYDYHVFDIEFDFVAHKLVFRKDDGATRMIGLSARTVADFYHEVMATVESLGISLKIWPVPVEIKDPIPFEQDTVHASYDPDYANRFWKVLVESTLVFEEFRSRFIGKVSPVHFFWGSFDLAVTRFSGRRAPERPGADAITREAYSHEVISHGFWPGGGGMEAAYYAYAAPEPEGFSKALIRPETAFYSEEMKEYFLPYDDARKATSPKDAVLEFAQSTYEAGADLGNWNRADCER
ncbi:MAG: DUF5996 family protein [Blastocatellia bacterium]